VGVACARVNDPQNRIFGGRGGVGGLNQKSRFLSRLNRN